jgi:hypothetical protein
MSSMESFPDMYGKLQGRQQRYGRQADFSGHNQADFSGHESYDHFQWS